MRHTPLSLSNVYFYCGDVYLRVILPLSIRDPRLASETFEIDCRSRADIFSITSKKELSNRNFPHCLLA